MQVAFRIQLEVKQAVSRVCMKAVCCKHDSAGSSASSRQSSFTMLLCYAVQCFIRADAYAGQRHAVALLYRPKILVPPARGMPFHSF